MKNLIDLSYETLDSNFIRRESIIEKLDTWFSDEKVRAVVFKAGSGYGKSTVISQFIDGIHNVRKLVLQVNNLNPQGILKDLGEHFGILKKDSSLPTDIASSLFDALDTQDTLLILDSFHNSLDSDGYIRDGNIKSLLDKIIHSGFQDRGIIIISTNRAIKGLDASNYRCEVLNKDDFKFSEKEGQELLRKYRIKGTPGELKNLLKNYQYHPYTLDCVANREKNQNVRDIKHATHSDLMESRFDKITSSTRNLIFFLSLFPHEIKKRFVQDLILDSKNPLHMEYSNFNTAISELEKSNIVTFYKGKQIDETLSIHRLTREYCRNKFKEEEEEKEKGSKSEFDVFLCYNSDDKELVIKIAHKLREKGIHPWLDEWELQPGRPWQEHLEKQIEKSRSVAVFIGENNMGPWQKMERDAFLQVFVERNCKVIPVILPDCQSPPNLSIFLRIIAWVDFRKNEPDPMEQLVWGITGKRSTDNYHEDTTRVRTGKFIQCHSYLYDYYNQRFEDSGDKDYIDPLYDAVWHGCHSERYNEALELFWNKISRGREFYSQAKGYYVRDIVCLSHFFPDGEDKPPTNELNDDAREWLPSIYSYLLKNLGNINKAIEIREKQIERAENYLQTESSSVSTEPIGFGTFIAITTQTR